MYCTCVRECIVLLQMKTLKNTSYPQSSCSSLRKRSNGHTDNQQRFKTTKNKKQGSVRRKEVPCSGKQQLGAWLVATEEGEK